MPASRSTPPITGLSVVTVVMRANGNMRRPGRPRKTETLSPLAGEPGGEQARQIQARYSKINLTLFNKGYCSIREAATSTIKEDNSLRIVIGSLSIRRGPVVFKQFFLEPKTNGEDWFASIRWELDVWTRLKHERILPLLGWAIHDVGYALVSPYFPNRDIQTYMEGRTVSLNQKLKWMFEIAEGMQYMHAKKCVFVDVKPSNAILKDDLSVMLCDFGVSIALDGRESGTVVKPPSKDKDKGREGFYGTIQYFAPERFRNIQPNFFTDVYSFGVTCFEILVNCQNVWSRPIETIKDMEKEVYIDKKVPNIPLYMIPPVLNDILSKCVSFESRDRPKLPEIIKKMSDYHKYRIARQDAGYPDEYDAASTGESSSKRARLEKSTEVPDSESMPPNALRGESQGESFGDQDNPGEQIPTLPKPPAEQTLLSSTSHDTTQDIASTVEPSPALPKQPVEEVLVHQPPNRQANTTIDIIQIARNGEPDDLLEFLEALTPDKWEQVFQIYQERVVQAEKIRDYRFTFSIAWMYCLGLGQPISLPDALKQWSHIARSKTSESTRSEGLRKSAAFLKFWFVALGVTFVENWAAAHEIEVLYKLGELPSGSDMQDYSLLFMWCRFGAERSELCRFLLSTCYLHGIGTAADPALAIVTIGNVATKVKPDVTHWYCLLGECYYSQERYDLAFSAFLSSCRHCTGGKVRYSPKANYFLGQCYEHGRGIEADPTMALKQYENANAKRYPLNTINAERLRTLVTMQ